MKDLGRFGCVDEVASTSGGWVWTSHVDVHLSCYLNLVRFVEDNGDRIYLVSIILFIDGLIFSSYFISFVWIVIF